MADFKIAYKLTAVNEGGYNNDSTDSGGETWKGIARNRFPKWPGWALIDNYKKNAPATFKELLPLDKFLEADVQEFYRTEFWNKLRGDEIKVQEVANEIYDTCVLNGIETGITLSQRSLAIKETGKMNDETLKKLNNE